MITGFPEAQSPTDQLSRLAGTDMSKMRLMKASLFTMEEDTEAGGKYIASADITWYVFNINLFVIRM